MWVCLQQSQSWLQQAQNQLLGPWDGLSILGKGCAHIPTFCSLLLNHCKSVLRAKRITRMINTLKSSWFTAELWSPVLSQMAGEQGSCHLESVSCGDTQLWLEAWGTQEEKQEQRWVTRPACPAGVSVCLSRREEGQEDIQVSWCDTPRCDRSSWSPLFVTATVAATSCCNLAEEQEWALTRAQGESPMDHKTFLVWGKGGGWWCLGAPAAAGCALSTWEPQPKQDRKHYLLQIKIF